MAKGSRYIIFFLPYSTGGVSKVVQNLLKYRSDFINQYKVVLTRLNQKTITEAANLNFFKAETEIFNYHSSENLYCVFERLRNYIPDEESILIANDGLELRMINALRIPNPLIYIVHGSNNYYYGLIEQFRNSMDKIITVSSYIKDQVQSKWPTEALKVNFIPFPVDDYKLSRNQFSVSNPVKILFVGSLMDSKGVLLLPEIVKRLESCSIKVELFVAGDGPLFNFLCTSFNKKDKVHLLGHVDNMKLSELYNLADILILPSYSEGLPNVVIEAMKCGCIPLVSNLPSGIPDIIQHGYNGFVADIGSVSDFSDKIIEIVGNSLIEELRKKTIQTANQNFDPYVQAKKYINVFNNICSCNKSFNTRRPGGVFNQSWLPNTLVMMIRSMNISKKF